MTEKELSQLFLKFLNYLRIKNVSKSWTFPMLLDAITRVCNFGGEIISNEEWGVRIEQLLLAKEYLRKKVWKHETTVIKHFTSGNGYMGWRISLIHKLLDDFDIEISSFEPTNLVHLIWETCRRDQTREERIEKKQKIGYANWEFKRERYTLTTTKSVIKRRKDKTVSAYERQSLANDTVLYNAQQYDLPE